MKFFYLWTLDISVIATGFAQLVDEGIIEPNNKEIVKVAIDRQILYASTLKDWSYSDRYISNLNVLLRALEAA